MGHSEHENSLVDEGGGSLPRAPPPNAVSHRRRERTVQPCELWVQSSASQAAGVQRNTLLALCDLSEFIVVMP